jgi:hypothetical protein
VAFVYETIQEGITLPFEGEGSKFNVPDYCPEWEKKKNYFFMVDLAGIIYKV